MTSGVVARDRSARDAAGVDLDALISSMPFAVANGVELTSASVDEVVGTLAWAPDRCTVGGVLHGGALLTLADSLGAILAYLNLPEGAVGTTTIETKTNLFRALREGSATATTTVLHAGRTTIVVQTDVRDAEGRRVSLTTQTQAVLRG
ncbi:PaaI family thioesterase [Iamia sp. SCSIO 61187]|nr:PaaI family thioesterase [Iamia sp. SCSIO 61187]